MIKRQWIWVGLLIALFLRLALIPNPGFEADISFWKAWGLSVVDKGIVEGLKASNNNYPTPFSYTLGAMVWVYKLFADPHNFNQFWTNTNLLFLAIAKMLPIAADFGIAAITLWFARMKTDISGKHVLAQYVDSRISPMGWLLALVYLLSPISLIDGAWWGQVDSLGVFVFLLSFLAILKKKPLLGGLVYMAAVMTKLQNMIYGPVFFLFIWQTLGYDGLIRAATGALIAFFGLNIEFFLSRNMHLVIASLTQNFDYFPLMSLNAYNLWWIVSGARGMAVSDKLLALGIMNAKTVGLVLFASFYLFAMLRQSFARHSLAKLQGFIESLILVNAGFFLFQTQSHDRYAFPLSVFLLLWAPFYVHFNNLSLRAKRNNLYNSEIATSSRQYIGTPRNDNRSKLFAILYSLFSVFYFYNLHNALVINYPHNGLPVLSSLTHPAFTLTASAVLLGLFTVFLVYLTTYTKRIVIYAAAAFLFTILLGGNLPLFTKKPVSLTRLTPYVSEQGYGTRQTNMPVNAFLGFPKQSYLSVQYAFYRLGIGTHSPSFMNYDIGRYFKTFAFDYGIDTEAGGKGSAVFEVYGDDRLLWQSKKIGRYESPRHAEVDVTGIKKLGLVTTDAGDGKEDDHTDWLNPRLMPL